MRDDLSFDDPCLLFALRRESQAFVREFPVQQRFPAAPCRARFCGPTWLTVLVMETGVGSAAVQKALDWATAAPLLGRVPYRPKLVLSAGFAGALADGYRVGDIVLADEVADAEGNCWRTTWPGDLPPGEWRPPIHRGRLLDSPVLVGEPQAKRDLGHKHGAVAV
ncbi:MAG TPA: hypothetical protein VFA26_06320, partial [Gemmataceae bacterium]|nr:hypothetical protein [Gemmataceae bacterium]